MVSSKLVYKLSSKFIFCTQGFLMKKLYTFFLVSIDFISIPASKFWKNKHLLSIILSLKLESVTVISCLFPRKLAFFRRHFLSSYGNYANFGNLERNGKFFVLPRKNKHNLSIDLTLGSPKNKHILRLPNLERCL